jgi:hypothetical protein
MNISRPDLSNSQPPRNNTETCTRNHYLACIKPPLNPSRRRKGGSETMTRNQTDPTNVERRSQPTHLGVTKKRNSRTTTRYWLVFPRRRSTSTRQIRPPAGAVDAIATIP